MHPTTSVLAATYTLVDEKDQPVILPAWRTTHLHRRVLVTEARPPHKPGSTGRVLTSGGEFFPSVVYLRFKRNT